MTLYVTLGLNPGATTGEIKRAYRRLARRYHPEINPGDVEAALRFRRIVEAYETLVDPERRRQYDTGQSRRSVVSDPAAFEFEGFDFSVAVEGTSASTFGDLFADVLRTAAETVVDGAGRGADLHGSAEVSFDESLTGTLVRLTVTRLDACAGCRGSGRLESIDTPCRLCHGSGTLKGARGHMIFTKPCPECGGTGERRHSACPACGGEGVAIRSDTVGVSVPPGVSDGEVVRVPGRGNVGRRGGPSGDLYVRIKVRSDPRYVRDGDDLHVEVPIALHEAAFGARIDVPSPSGPCSVGIPPGTVSGQQFRIRERGAMSTRTGRPGDLVVTTTLVLPPLADERTRELLRALAHAYPSDVRRDGGE